jgi:hypothetical protein
MMLAEMLSYPFLVRALVVGVLVSLCSSLLGVSLVLKRYSMIGDGLSHVGFGALAVATAFNVAPLAVAVPVVVVSAVLLLRLSQNSRIKGDAAIAMISSGALAVGVIVISLTTGMNTDVSNYMFGSILSLSTADARFSAVLSAAVLALFILFYPRIFRRDLRRDLRPGHRHQDRSIQYAHRRPHRRHGGAGHAHDGRAAHIQSHHLPAPLRHAGVPHLQIGGDLLRRRFRGLLRRRHAVLLRLELPTGPAVVAVNMLAFGAFALAGRLKHGK